jgi:hypothetical protein
MLAFDWKLTNDQIAVLPNYVRNSCNNGGPTVSASDVQSLRQSIQKGSN